MTVHDVRMHLEEDGYCVLDGLLAKEEVDPIAAHVTRVVDRVEGAYVNSADAIVHIPETAPLCIHPLVLEVAEEVLGTGYVLANNLKIKCCRPGAVAGGFHADWPTRAVAFPPPDAHVPPWGGLQVFWMLTQVTKENGATRVVPFSHHTRREPTRADYAQAVPITGTPGTLLLFHNGLWHASGANTTNDAHRVLANAYYVPRGVHLPADRWNRIPRAAYNRLPSVLQALVGRSVHGGA